MAFTETSQPTQRQAIYPPRHGDLIMVSFVSARFLAQEAQTAFQTAQEAEARGDEGQYTLLTLLMAGLADAMERRILLEDEIADYVREGQREEPLPSFRIGAWYASATAVLGLSRCVKQLLVAGSLNNMGTNVRLDFDWDYSWKGGLQVAKSVLERLGLQPPTGGKEGRWFEGDEVFAGVTAANLTPGFASYPYARGFDPNDNLTINPLIKREVWQAATEQQ